MAIYRKKCDNCGKEFKRGIRMDLVLNSITVLSGSPAWDTQDDLEFFAMFCSKDCMMKYLVSNLEETGD